jgi:hypothetical protein
MTDALAAHLISANAVGADGEVASLSREIRGGDLSDEALERLVELSVAWVLANPDPEPLSRPAYRPR